MEVRAPLGDVFTGNFVRLDKETLRALNPRKFPYVASTIDEMGEKSAEAQKLKRALTSYERAIASDDDQLIYLLWEPTAQQNVSRVIGLLKVGRRPLYLYDASMKNCVQSSPLSILDFYVHESRQRRGFGHQLYDFMLRQEGDPPHKVAIDRPSESLLAFMTKHYGLASPIWQSTHYVVYPEFFAPEGSVKSVQWAAQPALVLASPVQDTTAFAAQAPAAQVPLRLQHPARVGLEMPMPPEPEPPMDPHEAAHREAVMAAAAARSRPSSKMAAGRMVQDPDLGSSEGNFRSACQSAARNSAHSQWW